MELRAAKLTLFRVVPGGVGGGRSFRGLSRRVPRGVRFHGIPRAPALVIREVRPFMGALEPLLVEVLIGGFDRPVPAA